MLHWYAIYTQPGRELLVNRQLEDRDLEVYLPVIQFDRGGEQGIWLEPFFPNYLFAKVDTTLQCPTGLCWLPGVRSIVEADEQPMIVPDAVIHMLQERLDTATKRVLRTSDRVFARNDQHWIADGPFQGFEAVFQPGLSGDQRVQIWLGCMDAAHCKQPVIFKM